MPDIKKPTEFQEGILCAAAIVLATSDQPVIAADLLRAVGLADMDCSDLNDYDKHYLRIVNKETSMKLTGLD